jgi:glycosyltransferase involved in cell wall biosynthesis
LLDLKILIGIRITRDAQVVVPDGSGNEGAAAWVKEILIVDSGSTDATLEFVGRYPHARVVNFDSFAEQCNFGLAQVTTAWVLSMDADYELTPEAASEMRALAPLEAVSGYRAGFIYRIYGRALCATLYPPRIILYRPQRAYYRNEGHSHRVVLEGEVRDLAGKIGTTTANRWRGGSPRSRTTRVAKRTILTEPRVELRRTDYIRLMGWPAPILVFLYTLFWKRCLLDGWPGWLYVLQRTLAEILISIELIGRKLRNSSTRFAGD